MHPILFAHTACTHNIHSWTLISGFYNWGQVVRQWDSTASHLLPPLANATRPSFSFHPPLTSPTPTSQSPSLNLGHDCAGCGWGSPVCRTTLLPRERSQERSHGATKEVLLWRLKEFWVSKGCNSSPHSHSLARTLTHTLLVWPFQASWRSSIYQTELRRNPWSSCYYATPLG